MSYFTDWYEIEVKGGPEFVSLTNLSVTSGRAEPAARTI
jgi:hypothetical protein